MEIFNFRDQIYFFRANLSRDYFMNRQDRYILFKDCPNLADFFADIVNATLSHSFTLAVDGSTIHPSALPFDPLSSRKTAKAFKLSLGKAIGQLTRQTSLEMMKEASFSSEFDTIIFPLIQMGFCGIKQDEAVTSQLLGSLGEQDSLRLASGYFNLPPLYSNTILKGRGRCSILAASPQVCLQAIFPLKHYDSPLERQMVSLVLKVLQEVSQQCTLTLHASSLKRSVGVGRRRG